MDTNSSIHKINQSRYNLKKYLQNEWDISIIYDYSDKEIEQLYRLSKPQNSNISFGFASGCNFHLFHKKLQRYYLLHHMYLVNKFNHYLFFDFLYAI